jgi:putative Mn2+ efflux pump MntP
MIQQSELLVLALAVALGPFVAWAYRGINFRERRWLAAALIAMVTAYVATILEGFVAMALLNAVEHAAFAIAGACFTIAILGLLKMSRRGDDETEPA